MSIKKIAPVLKWAGGKRQSADVLAQMFPKEISAYFEPFVGGGAMLFKLQPETAYINDINCELMRVYEVTKNDAEALIEALGYFRNEEEHYYSVRNWDKDSKNYSLLPDVIKAARTVYLNKTCYNGLFRVNGAGEFNTPFGNYRNPNIINATGLRAVGAYLNTADVRISALDFEEALRAAPDGAFVYLDPPYDPVSDTSGFTGYAIGGFTQNDQIRLRGCCDELDKRGLKFLLSNSATDFIKELYSPYNITVVRAKRPINSNASKRGEVDEVAVRNY